MSPADDAPGTPLRGSGNPLEVILRNVTEGITAIDTRGHIVYANDAAARLCGFPDVAAMRAVPLGEVAASFDLFDEDGAPVSPDALPTNTALLGEHPSEILLRWRTRATRVDRWSIVNAVPVFDAAGQVQLVITIFHDVTERVRRDHRALLLERATAQLGATLDAEVALRRFVAILLPELADWCELDVKDDQDRLRVILHADPGKTRWAEELDRRWPRDEQLPRGPAAVRRTGEAELTPEVSDEMLQLAARDAEHLEALRKVGMQSYMCVPLRGRDAILGTMMLVSAEGARRFDETDLALAQDLAARATAFVESSRLYRDARLGRRQAELHADRSRLLAEAARAFAEAGIAIDQVLETVARRTVEVMGDACGFRTLSADGTQTVHRAAVVADGFPVPETLWASLCAPRPAGSAGTGSEVLRTGETRIFRDVEIAALQRAYGSDPIADALARLRPTCLAVFPLRAGGKVFGLLAAGRLGGRPAYDQGEIVVLQELADLAALAIENARLSAEARAAEEERATLLDRERSANRAKDEFLAVLGHELRNPLSPILTALQIMELSGSSEGTREREVIRRQAQHLVHLVDDLLDVSRITRGKVELTRRPVELATIVADAIETSGPLLEQRRHQLRLEVPQEGLAVAADPHRLAQAVANLVTNAAKYTDPGGTIAVSAALEDGEVVLRVRDDGIGISAELLPRLFDLFVQGDRIVERAQGGLGLGLSIARSLVALHGGTIAARSDGPGKGSEITVRLPRTTAGVSMEPSTPMSEGAQPGARRILIVDDNEDAAELLAELLAALGHSTRTAYDGPSALGAAAEFRPDVALLDLGLPVMDGFELAKRLRAERALEGLCLIALTGYGQQSDRERTRAAGFDAHLVKPVDARTVQATIRELSAPPG